MAVPYPVRGTPAFAAAVEASNQSAAPAQVANQGKRVRRSPMGQSQKQMNSSLIPPEKSGLISKI